MLHICHIYVTRTERLKNAHTRNSASRGGHPSCFSLKAPFLPGSLLLPSWFCLEAFFPPGSLLVPSWFSCKAFTTLASFPRGVNFFTLAIFLCSLLAVTLFSMMSFASLVAPLMKIRSKIRVVFAPSPPIVPTHILGSLQESEVPIRQIWDDMVCGNTYQRFMSTGVPLGFAWALWGKCE